MLDSNEDDPTEHWAEARKILLVEQIARLQSHFSQQGLWDITASPLEIMSDVFYNVCQLQTFPETHPDLGHLPDIP